MRITLHTYIIIYFIQLVMTLGAQTLDAQSELNLRHLSPNVEGFPLDISMTTQGKDGNVWMLSDGQIFLYNGYNYEKLSNKALSDYISPADRIMSIKNDATGDLWLFTYAGRVLKYDVHRQQLVDINQLIDHNNIKLLIVENNLKYLLTENGDILKLNESQEITTITNIGSAPFEVKNITAFQILNDSIAFFGTTARDMYKFDIPAQTVSSLDSDYYGISFNMELDDYGVLWIGTVEKGLYAYDTKDDRFITNRFMQGEIDNLTSSIILNLYLDNAQNLWVGTDGDGLYKINTQNGETRHFLRNEADPKSFSNNTIRDVFEDRDHNLWFTTKYGNIYISPFYHESIGYDSGSRSNVPQTILSILKSSKEDLWIGTDGAGIKKVGADHTSYYFTENDFYAQSLAEDSQGDIWVGSYKNGLWIINDTGSPPRNLKYDYGDGRSPSDIRTVFNDSKGRIWVGDHFGISIFSSDKKKLASVPRNTNGLNGYIAQGIVEDENGRIWIGMVNGGLKSAMINENDISKTVFVNHQPSDGITIKSVNHLVSDKNGKLWILNQSSDIFYFDTRKNKFTKLEKGTTNYERLYRSIEVEDSENIWLSSKNGIIHHDLKENNSEILYENIGLQGNYYITRSSFKDKDGVLYFGGTNGLSFFHPSAMDRPDTDANIQITGLNILHKSAEEQIPSQILSGLNNVEKISLRNNQSSFSIKFAAIGNVLNPDFNYEYILDGFDKEWIQASERNATYTNIPSGNYVFKVRANVSDGNQKTLERKIMIRVKPHILLSWPAIFFYLTLLTLVAVAISRWYRLKKSLFMEKVIHRKDQELHETKMDFFAKMSHEIQTPITIILGPIEDMINRAVKNGDMLLKQRLKIISGNADRLSKIARKLTLLRDKEYQHLKLIITRNDLHSNIKEIETSFKELARQKKIDFEVHCPSHLTKEWYDKDKLSHVIYNLLSNAFKFTPEDGSVFLEVAESKKSKKVEIVVSDSGSGIPPEELEKIWQLFYQSEENKKQTGSGIGLSLVKDIIELHRGEITVDSKKGQGTTFRLTLDTAEFSYDENEKILMDDYTEPEASQADINEIVQSQSEFPEGRTLLVVEDNLDLQNFLIDLLKPFYNVITAENGEEGYFYAESNRPDLILTDIMMPKMDGIEMCEKLQANPLTQPIPIIMLTAKNSTKAKIAGLKSGAIEFINKPFNTNELLLKINNILISKENLISQYRKQKLSDPNFVQKKSNDEIFLENLIESIKSRLDMPNFKMEELAEDLNMGYSTLYRKCQKLTGYSLVDYVRYIRLKKAAVLMVKYGYSVSQTAYRSGFNDPKYFSRCFKKQFSKTPVQFKKEAEHTGEEKYLAKHELTMQE
ncbi:two-component regulator propeller domain-containing protein [Portibacter marinus]|uniref:two-component regulator propeller domain-containing protein n=1 Tax=Portibacter marinus TaxID=2898660 RepID=UPI001F219D31|nr:two-component regulator propeller domain-containing protein [Portibacter marinus]